MPNSKTVKQQKTFSETQIVRWRKKYSGLDEAGPRRLEERYSENAQLKKIGAEHVLLIDSLQGGQCKRVLNPQQVHVLIDCGVSRRQACSVVNLSRSTYWYRSTKQTNNMFRQRVLDIALYPRLLSSCGGPNSSSVCHTSLL